MRTLNKVIIVLIFILAGVLFTHNLTSINVDIGRHIKLGEIIWQTKSVPDTNLFSFTAPDHPFINHHWLSEVIFYGVYSLGSNPVKSSGDDHGASWMNGLKAIMIFKVIVLLATYFLLFLTVRKLNIFAIALAFLVSIFVFSARTEPRPEIFSYLIFAAYLLIIYRTRLTTSDVHRTSDVQTLSWLWLLPVLQLFWVNLHIYFILGPIIYLFFLIDEIVRKKVWKLKNWSLIENWKLKIGIFISVISANLANPNFIAGALYPLKVLNSYGYNVVENSSLFSLASYFGRWSPQDKLFLISLFVLAGSFIVSFWIKKLTTSKLMTSQVVRDLRSQRVFDLLLIAMMAILSFKMQRNIPLFALSLWPVMTKNLDGIWRMKYGVWNMEKARIIFHVGMIFVLTTSIYLVVSGRFYNWLDSSKTFGLNVSSAARDGTDFAKENNIQGPVFNNFDIGSYLVWQLFPDQKIFVDGRPEAYPVEFFEDIYKLMQRDEKVWEEMSQKYDINYIFFAHTDMTEWSQEFLTRIAKNPEWPMVFLNDAVIIFLKDTPDNRSIVDKHKFTDDNLNEKIVQTLNKLNKNDNNAFVNFGNALYRFNYLSGAAIVYEALIENQPDNPYGYQGAGYAYASMNDPATQQMAADNLKKAIDLSLKTFNNYFTLGIINANLGDPFAAEENIRKALEINPDSQNARQALEVIQNKLKLKM